MGYEELPLVDDRTGKHAATNDTKEKLDAAVPGRSVPDLLRITGPFGGGARPDHHEPEITDQSSYG